MTTLTDDVMTASKLDQLRAMTTVVADTGDIEAVRRLKPVDCTTNPTLLLKAVETPAYAAFVEEAIAWGKRQSGSGAVEAVCDRLAVVALTRINSGRSPDAARERAAARARPPSGAAPGAPGAH